MFMLEYEFDGGTYGIRIPARDWAHAEEIAAKIGAKVLGDNVHEQLALPVPQLMDFLSACADEPIQWKYNAEEQIAAFLTIGWPVRGERWDSPDGD